MTSTVHSIGNFGIRHTLISKFNETEKNVRNKGNHEIISKTIFSVTHKNNKKNVWNNGIIVKLMI